MGKDDLNMNSNTLLLRLRRTYRDPSDTVANVRQDAGSGSTGHSHDLSSSGRLDFLYITIVHVLSSSRPCVEHHLDGVSPNVSYFTGIQLSGYV